MDGSGKSTAALELVARLEERGRPAVISWSRLAAESELLDLIAAPVRRVLRRSRPTAAAEATAGLEGLTRGDASAASNGAPSSDEPSGGGGGPVKSVWVAIVAAVNARSSRRSARLARDGVIVVCDRWLVDALVDLELRYGHHRAASWILRRATPHADLAVLLEIDAATSIARKPGDHAPAVLERMAGLYADAAGAVGFPPAGEEPRAGLVRIDARGSREDVLGALESRIGAVLAARGISG
jgi:thymidylate kinase